ncbi:MAG: TetR family transcriptional regulator [Myxococcales bacterium]|nr:TetR family transcriptional regulator [Myxococcales bacterium]
MLNARSKQARRLEILDGALTAIRDRGLKGAGMREIARAAGLSTGNLYYYFRNKEELVYACQDRALDQLLEVLALAKGRPGSSETLGALVEGHLQVVMAGGASLHLDVDDLPRPLFKKIVQKRDKYERGVRELLAEGQRDGEVRSGDTKLQAFALLGALNWVARWYRPGQDDEPDIIHSFKEQLLRGLLWQRI